MPGLNASALPERPDPEPSLSGRFAALLGAIGAGQDSDMLAPALRNPGKAPRVAASLGYGGDIQRFAFLECENLGDRGEERFGTIVSRVYRYKLVSKTGTIYYTFEVTPAGKVSGIIPEKD